MRLEIVAISPYPQSNVPVLSDHTRKAEELFRLKAKEVQTGSFWMRSTRRRERSVSPDPTLTVVALIGFIFLLRTLSGG